MDENPEVTEIHILKHNKLKQTDGQQVGRRCSKRVCRAWHKTREVEVLLLGIRRAEG